MSDVIKTITYKMAIEQNSLPDERTILDRKKRLIGRAK